MRWNHGLYFFFAWGTVVTAEHRLSEERRIQHAIESTLVRLARYYRNEGPLPQELAPPPGGLRGTALTKAWTRAEIEYFAKNFCKEGLAVKREHGAGLRLPPDLTAFDSNAEVVIHVERETRGWEWNHVFGALVKLLIANERPARFAVLVLDNLRLGDNRLELLTNVSRKLLSAASGVVCFYLAVWFNDGTRAEVFRIDAADSGPLLHQLIPEGQAIK